ncbi:CGGC domain-containing protein [Phocaeicola dorei]|uniref:CGGC domain-containing protein n=1 Tax=Phocaeicola dorei TaxID=357276 RepID=A0A5M5ZP78_9BACT|nr:CGGC domain-containing protein [Phocaeicola dorei]KAA5379389.1 CGGC domain-containing protein [Phocaeicola dorei]
MKLGIIRCQQTEDFCPGSTCFHVARNKKGAFEGTDGNIEIVGFTNCGGCPGKKAVLRARMLVERGADTIAFASCIQKGTPIGYPCPFGRRMKELLVKNLPENIRILDYTHDAPDEKKNHSGSLRSDASKE